MRWMVFAVALLLAGPAHAGWQYARWGMTLDQLLAASGGSARAASEDDRRGTGAEAVSRYSTDGIEFRTYFGFKAGRLATVSLKPERREQIPAIRTALLARYGTPHERDAGRHVSKLSWRDERNGNLVEFIDIHISGDARITYSNLAVGSGL